MIIFNQPYQIDYIKVLGDYPSKQVCVQERGRALDSLTGDKHSPVSFGCVKILQGRGGQNEVGSSKKHNL